MRRREFVTLLGGAAAWPLAARAQQRERMRRIGVLVTTAADDPEGQPRVAAFLQGLHNGAGPLEATCRSTSALVQTMPPFVSMLATWQQLAPDVILANSSTAVAALLQATRTVPIVFAIVADPVGAGFVDS
jgi:putative ABC transport system substrate-binding protein